jgi:hypothetical protein
MKINLKEKLFFFWISHIYGSKATFSSSEDSCNTGFACGNKLGRKAAGVLIPFQN